MAPDTTKKTARLLAKARHPLILLPSVPSFDALGAGYGLSHILTKKGAHTTLAYASDNITPHMRDVIDALLPQPHKLLHSLKSIRELVIEFNTKRNGITNVRTEKSKSALTIYITPEKNMMDPGDFSFAPAQFPYDLVIALGAQSKESFGPLYEHCPDLFYDVPVINIDVSSDNDGFGKINYVDLTTAATSELLYTLLQKQLPTLIDKESAQSFLLGIIDATHSFQDADTTPHTLHAASALIEHGADQQKIITQLYRRQSLQKLKLWGAAMATMQWHDKQKIVSALVQQADFADTNTTVADLPEIIEKIKTNYSSGKIFALLYEDTDDTIRIMIDAGRLGNLSHLNKLPGAEEKNGIYHLTSAELTLSAGRDALIDQLGA